MGLRARVLVMLGAVAGCSDPPGEAVITPGDGGGSSSGGATSGASATSAASEGSTTATATAGGTTDGGTSGGSADTVAPVTSGDTDASTGMAVSATSGGVDTGASTSIGMASTGMGPGSTSTGEPMCDDADEGNEPVELADITCDDGPTVVMGVMDGPTSPDLWAFHGVVPSGECSNEAQPKVTVTNGSPLRVCIWSVAGCDVTCPEDAVDDDSMGNGCCRNDDLEISDLECNGNDSSDVLVSVSDEAADCRPYTLEIRY